MKTLNYGKGHALFVKKFDTVEEELGCGHKLQYSSRNKHSAAATKAG